MNALFQVINSSLNKLFLKKCIQYSLSISKLQNDKIVHNYRTCMINRTILIILLGNCIFNSKQRITFRFQTENIQ